MKSLIASIMSAAAVSAALADPVSLTLGRVEDGKAVPSSLWGIFLEDINWAADGGLNPELLANGGFDWKQADHEKWNTTVDGWEPDFRDGGMARLSFQYGSPVHPNTAKHLRIESFGAGAAGVRNRGMDGIRLVEGEPYRLQFDVREVVRRGIDYDLGAWSREVKTFTWTGAGFTVEKDGYGVELTADSLSVLVRGRRVFEFDNVSLLPTGSNLVRAGMRKDLVDRLAALKPAFVRFPGGCIVEEGDFQHWYDWRRTVGPKERRECVWNRWGTAEKPYWETFAIGFYEYFILCEELGAEPLPICLAGITCQYQPPALLCDVKDADFFAEVIIELIEFANGDATTRWGKVRSEMGHPEPFALKMVGVGNENWNAEFFDRYEPIVRIVRARHPEIRIVGSSGPAPEGKEFDYAWGRVTRETADLVDEHFYRPPEWFLKSARRYDGYDRRAKPLVYAGEYACHHRIDGRRVNTHLSAICEAVAMTGFERNCDVVKMASYAPLFARIGHDQWSPNLIWFDRETSYVTPNYYVQQLFFLNRPETEIPVTISAGDEQSGIFACAGRAGKDTIVKIVNTAEVAREVRMNLAGPAVVTTLAGSRNDVNAIGAEKVKPVEQKLSFGGSIAVAPLSVTVLRVTDG